MPVIPSLPPVRSRLAWLDLFRGACVVGMVETHVLNTFLAAPSRETTWFTWLTYFDGLIAPAFLFIAGYAQGLGMRQSGEAPRPWRKKARRLAEILLLGFALHLPVPQMLAGRWGEAIWLGTEFDVLHCLAVSLALLLAAEVLARRFVDVLALLGLVLAVVVFREGVVPAWIFPPEWMPADVHHRTGVLFPLNPWMGFVCAGFLASAARALPATVGAFVGVTALGLHAPSSVGFFFERLAWLLAAVPVVQWIAIRTQPRGLLFIGRESLVLYAAHLLLIETLAVTLLPRHGLGVAACALLFGGVVAASMAIAIAWRAP